MLEVVVKNVRGEYSERPTRLGTRLKPSFSRMAENGSDACSINRS